MLNYFSLNGIDYYFLKGKYYADNMTIRKEITSKEYKSKMTDFLIL